MPRMNKILYTNVLNTSLGGYMYTISLINLLSNPVKRPQTPLQSMDSEREKFRTYIEKTGVMSALTDALVQLYEEQERPSDALGHIKKTLGSFTPSIQHCHMLEEKVTGQKREREREEKGRMLVI